MHLARRACTFAKKGKRNIACKFYGSVVIRVIYSPAYMDGDAKRDTHEAPKARSFVIKKRKEQVLIPASIFKGFGFDIVSETLFHFMNL